MEYILLVIIWVLYSTLHSWLISISVTEFIKQKLGVRYMYYRLFYNIFSVISLVPAVVYSYSINGEDIVVWDKFSFGVRLALIFIAVILIFTASKNYDLLQTAGIRQIKTGKTHRVLSSGGEIKDSGVLGLVRHPLYSAVFILLWARDLSVVSIIISTVLSLYLIIGTMLEEKKLIVEFGNQYIEYRKNVSMFFPFKWLKRNIFN